MKRLVFVIILAAIPSIVRPVSAAERSSTRPGLVTSASEWPLRRAQILRDMQEVMGPVPTKWAGLSLEMQIVETTDLAKYTRKKITFRVEPEDRLTAWLLIPKNLTTHAPAVLCLHQTTEIGKDSPAGLGGNPDLYYAHELAERGYITLAPDYWTFGDYRRSDYDPYKHGYQSGTMKGIWNHIRSIDLLQGLKEVDPDRIGCIGHSLGGHNALFVAAFDPRIKAVVSSCGFNTFASYAASRYGNGDLRNWAQPRYMPRIASVYGNDPRKLPFDFPEVLAAIAPRHVFINAPLHDENFVIDGVKDCLTAARPVFKLLNAEDHLRAIHPDAAHAFPKEARQAAYTFFDGVLKIR